MCYCCKWLWMLVFASADHFSYTASFLSLFLFASLSTVFPKSLLKKTPYFSHEFWFPLHCLQYDNFCMPGWSIGVELVVCMTWLKQAQSWSGWRICCHKCSSLSPRGLRVMHVHPWVASCILFVCFFFLPNLPLIISGMLSDVCCLERLVLKLVSEATWVSQTLQLQEGVPCAWLLFWYFFSEGKKNYLFLLNKVSILAEEHEH